MFELCTSGPSPTVYMNVIHYQASEEDKQMEERWGRIRVLHCFRLQLCSWCCKKQNLLTRRMSEKTREEGKGIGHKWRGREQRKLKAFTTVLRDGHSRDHQTPRAIPLKSEDDRHKVAETKTKKTHDPLTWQKPPLMHRGLQHCQILAGVQIIGLLSSLQHLRSHKAKQ